jgi:hypothetical protein
VSHQTIVVLYLFGRKFVKMAPATHNAATNQINPVSIVLTDSLRGSPTGCGGQRDFLISSFPASSLYAAHFLCQCAPAPGVTK